MQRVEREDGQGAWQGDGGGGPLLIRVLWERVFATSTEGKSCITVVPILV